MTVPNNYFETKLPHTSPKIQNWFSSLGDTSIACAGWASFSDDVGRTPYTGSIEDSHSTVDFGDGSGSFLAAAQMDASGPSELNSAAVYTRASEEGDGILVHRMSMFATEEAAILCPGASNPAHRVMKITKHIAPSFSSQVLPKIIPLKSVFPDETHPFTVCYASGTWNRKPFRWYFGFSWITNEELVDAQIDRSSAGNAIVDDLRRAYAGVDASPSVMPVTCPSDAIMTLQTAEKNTAYAITVITPSLDKRTGSVAGAAFDLSGMPSDT